MNWGIEVKDALSCPFCGGKALRQTSHPYTHQSPVDDEKFYFVCDCGVKGPEAKTEADALKRWNARNDDKKGKLLRRTFCGIQFVRHQDGYMRAGDGVPHWESVSGIKLFNGAITHDALEANWEIQMPDGRRISGFSVEDAMMNAGVLPRS